MATSSDIAEIKRRIAPDAAASRASADTSAPTLHNDAALAPIKHPQQDFFLAQIRPNTSDYLDVWGGVAQRG